MEVLMRWTRWLMGVFLLLGYSANPGSAQQIGKYIPIQAGSEVDHAVTEINATSDPAQKLALIDKFAEGPGKEGDYPILADGLYVDYYLAQKNYGKAFEYGDKLFALDPDSFSNAMNMIRAASEKGDADRLISYGEKIQAISACCCCSPIITAKKASNSTKPRRMPRRPSRFWRRRRSRKA